MSSTDNVVPFNWRPEPEPEPVGFAQVSKAWLSRWSTDRRLTSGEQKICVRIYLHFNSDHFKETGDLLAWPSWQFLMDATGLSRPSVHRTLRGLKRLGAFETQRGPYDHENKKRGNTRYIVRTSKVSPVRPSRGEQGLISQEQGLTSVQSKVSPGITRRGESNRRGESGSGDSSCNENSKIGLPRGPSAPEEEKPFSSDSPKPSSPRSTFDVLRPTTVLPAEFQKWLGGLPRMPGPRHWDHRQKDTATLERYRRAVNGSGKTMGVSS
jgi:hypothetical protein